MNPGRSTHITIDDRELHGPMPAVLATCDDIEIETRRLTVGDYDIDDVLLFERKTLSDLAQSTKDGRLFDQASRLVNAPKPAALILEGRGADLAASGMRREAILGALLNVSLFIGLPILRTRDAAETVRTMLYAAHQHHAIAHGALPRHGHRPKGKAALQSYILQGLPNVGPERAARLLHRFGKVEAVMSAEFDALVEVDGIGPGVARKMRWAVEESAENYRLPA